MELKEKEDKSSTAESSFYPERYKATINIVLITGKTLLILILGVAEVNKDDLMPDTIRKFCTTPRVKTYKTFR